jgi:aspartate aminotransferase-like enzyme
LPRSHNLFTPGPVNVRSEVLRALALPVRHHRSAEFEALWKDVGLRLAEVLRTEGPVAVLAGSGTAGMEAAVANLFSAGDRVLVPVAGRFARRWAEICEAFGVDVERLPLAAGESPSPDQVSSCLKRDSTFRGVLLVQCETSTGSLTDLEGVARAVRDAEAAAGHPILVCSDSITSLAIDPLETDRWGLDAVVSASQKGLLSPPGLAFVALSNRARETLEGVRQRRYYFDLRRYLRAARPPFTPPVSLCVCLSRSLDLVLAAGLERIWKASAASASALRALFEVAGFAPVARRQAGGAVAFWVGDAPADAIFETLRDEYGILIARGQDELEGKILRVSAIGKARSEILLFAEAFCGTLAGLGLATDADRAIEAVGGVLEDTGIWE